MLFKFLSQIKEKLKFAKFADYELEAELIVSEITDIKRMDFLLHQDYVMSNKEKSRCLQVIERRIKKEPLQYILGYAYFRELCLSVGDGVLIPRPETELIIDIIKPYIFDGANICDVATGSGAIALSIAYEADTNINITGIDISPKALKYAEINKEKYNLSNVEFLLGNLLSPCKNKKFDIITANLPYISSAEFAKLDCEVRNFEPKLALFAEKSGIAIIEELIEMATSYLNDKGIIILEIGYEQGNITKELFQKNKLYDKVKILKDYNKKDRFVMATFVI